MEVVEREHTEAQSTFQPRLQPHAMEPRPGLVELLCQHRVSEKLRCERSEKRGMRARVEGEAAVAA